MSATGAQPTHANAEVMLTQLRGALDEYAAEVDTVFAPEWNCLCAGGGSGAAGKSAGAPAGEPAGVT
jgi:hypothetical protein